MHKFELPSSLHESNRATLPMKSIVIFWRNFCIIFCSSQFEFLDETCYIFDFKGVGGRGMV